MKHKKMKWNTVSAYLFILPSLLLLITFHIVPIFMTAGYSLTKYNVLQPAEFIGPENYRKLLTDPYIKASLYNTGIYTLIVVPAQTILSMVIAYLLAQKCRNRFGNFVRSALFIPVITSMILTAAVWRLLLSGNAEGVINSIIGIFGIKPVNWMGARWPALFSVCLIAIWKNVGYFMVIFYAGMMDIPTALYEAATVDGAGAYRQFRSITLPMLKPITYLVVTLGTIWSFQVFDLVYTLTGGGPGRATMTPVLTIYNSAFKEYKMGYASAVSMLLLAIVLFISLLQKLLFLEKAESKKGAEKVMKNQKKKRVVQMMIGLFLLLLVIVSVYPFVFMILTSFTQKKIMSASFDFKTMDLRNYRTLTSNFPVFTYLKNSVIVVSCACFFNVVIATLAGYAFAKKKFPLKEGIFWLYLATLMMPGQVILIPVFTIMKNMNLLNTYPSLFLIILDAFGIFLMRQFMEGIPDELMESARIDGCGELGTFTRIILPLSKPVIVSLVVFTFITSWNDFIWPLVMVTRDEMKTLTLGLSMLQNNYVSNYGLIMAGAALAFIFPFILYCILQKQFVEGIALSGIKG